MGDGTFLGEGLHLTAWDQYTAADYPGGIQTFSPEITIGRNCRIGKNNHITAINKIVIGDGCLTGHSVTITDNSHGDFSEAEIKIEPALRKLVSKGPVIVGRHVWIGEKATILPNVVIGDNVIVGANAVVSKSVPPNCIVVGNPAKIIRRLA